MVVECSGIPDDFGNWYENVKWMGFEEFLNSDADLFSDEVNSFIKAVRSKKDIYLSGLLRETKIN